MDLTLLRRTPTLGNFGNKPEQPVEVSGSLVPENGGGETQNKVLLLSTLSSAHLAIDIPGKREYESIILDLTARLV